MIEQINKPNAEGLYSLEKVTQSNNTGIEQPISEKDKLKDPEDVLTISEGGNIKLSFFKSLDGGGKTSESEKKEVSITIKPNFLNVTTTKYAQMKAEIEKRFSDDPAAKHKYLTELDKALDDYVDTQAKVISDVLGGRNEKKAKETKTEEAAKGETKTETKETENDRASNDKRTRDESREEIYNRLTGTNKKYIDTFKSNYEELDLKEAIKEADSKISDEDIREIYSFNDKDMDIIFEKIFGKQEHNYSDEVSKVIDDLFSNALTKQTNSNSRENNGLKLKPSVNDNTGLSRSDIIDKILLTQPNRPEFKDSRISQ